eukprot:1152862-Pelagomonas_calceolata.AAC.2
MQTAMCFLQKYFCLMGDLQGPLQNKHTMLHQISNPKERKIAQAEGSLPTSIKEKETYWLRRAGSPLHHNAVK